MCEGRLLADVVAVIGSIDIVLGRDRPMSDDVASATGFRSRRQVWDSLVSLRSAVYTHAAMGSTQ